MKKLMLLAAILGFAFSMLLQAEAGQDDCKEGEKWNETTQAGEKSGG